MKTIIGMVIVAAMILTLRVLFLAPTGVNGYVKYEGITSNTKIVMNIPVVDMSLELPRFPLDVLAYSPLKLIDYVDINVLDKRDTIKEHRIFLTKPLNSNYGFVFCYLRMLYEYGVDLPVRFSSKDINYDVEKYIDDDITVFSLATVDLESVVEQDFDQLMRSLMIQAQRDTSKMIGPEENCIVEASLGQQTRYLWGYYISGKYLYVIDPCAPQLLYARVDTATGEYQVGLDTYKVRSYIKKTKVPIVEGDDDE